MGGVEYCTTSVFLLSLYLGKSVLLSEEEMARGKYLAKVTRQFGSQESLLALIMTETNGTNHFYWLHCI